MEGWLRKRSDLQFMVELDSLNAYSYHRLTMYQQFPEPAVLLESYEANSSDVSEAGNPTEVVELWSCDNHCTLTWQVEPLWKNTGRMISFKLHKADGTAPLLVCLEAKNEADCSQWMDALRTTVPEKYDRSRTPRGMFSPRTASEASDLDKVESSKKDSSAPETSMLLQVKDWLREPFRSPDVHEKKTDLDLPDSLEMMTPREGKAEARTEVEAAVEAAAAVDVATLHSSDPKEPLAVGTEPETATKPPVTDGMTRAYLILLAGTICLTATAATGVLCVTHPGIVAATGIGVAKAIGIHTGGSTTAAAAPAVAAPVEPLTTGQQLSVVNAALM